MSLSLGIDLGTSGIRTAALDGGGAVLSMARSAHLAHDLERIDADLWWQAVQTCIVRQVAALAEHGRAGTEITDIAVDGTSGSMVLIDDRVQPVSCSSMYNSKGLDAEAAGFGDGAHAAHITRGSNPALALALRIMGETSSGGVQLLHQADFIATRLKGIRDWSNHSNALKTGYDLEAKAEAWRDRISDLVTLNFFPEILHVSAPFGAVLPDVAAQRGLGPAARVHAGTTDSIAALLAEPPPSGSVWRLRRCDLHWQSTCWGGLDR